MYEINGEIVDKNIKLWNLTDDEYKIIVEGANAIRNRLQNINSQMNKSLINERASIIKSRATGNSSLPGKDRFFMACKIDLEEFFIFISQFCTLDESLEDILKKKPCPFLASNSISNNLTVVISTEDAPDWRLWDRRCAINSVLNNCETVTLHIVPTEDVKNSQKNIEDAYIRCKEIENEIKIQEEIKMKAQVKPVLVLYEKGDRALYRDIEECTVIDKHLDDFPNVYYTIRMKEDGREKQTTPQHLSYKQWAPVPSEKGGLHLRIDWLGEKIDLIGVNPCLTIQELREHMNNHVRSSNRRLTLTDTSKLIYKGTVLQNNKVISKLNIKSGSKIMVIG